MNRASRESSLMLPYIRLQQKWISKSTGVRNLDLHNKAYLWTSVAINLEWVAQLLSL